MYHLSKSFYFSILLVLASPIVSSKAIANDLDLNFVSSRIKDSNCNLDADQFSKEFSVAIDRLEKINPNLVKYIRSKAYQRSFAIKCDVARGERGIYFTQDQSIHLWQDMETSWRTSASFFHEFLHFVGVKVDMAYHNDPDPQNIVEIDSVYACHISVFPQLAPLVDVVPSRIPAANARCAMASAE